MSRWRDCRTSLCIAAALGLLLCLHAAQAVDSITLDMASLEGSGWHAEGFSVRMPAGAAASADLTIDEVTLPGPVTHLRAVHAHCEVLRFIDGRYECGDASARFDLAQRGRVELRGRFTYDPAKRALDLEATARDAGNETLTLHAGIVAERWTVDLDTRSYAVATLAPWLAELVRWTETAQPAGSIALRSHAEGRGASMEVLHTQAVISGLTISAFEDRLAAEALDGTLEFDARPRSGGVP